jgi:lysozyme
MTNEQLQAGLVAAGYYKGRIDGIIGPRTRAAFQQFVFDGIGLLAPAEAPTPARPGMTARGLVALANREAIVLSTYRDSKGIPTIGGGHTAAAGEPIPVPGLTLTLDEAFALFRRDVQKYYDQVRAAVKVDLLPHQWDALTSFHYNTGAIKRAKLTAAINAGEMADHIIRAGFRNWLKPAEIEGRRMDEYRQFVTGDYGDVSKIKVYDKFPGKVRMMSTDGLLLAA